MGALATLVAHQQPLTPETSEALGLDLDSSVRSKTWQNTRRRRWVTSHQIHFQFFATWQDTSQEGAGKPKCVTTSAHCLCRRKRRSRCTLAPATPGVRERQPRQAEAEGIRYKTQANGQVVKQYHLVQPADGAKPHEIPAGGIFDEGEGPSGQDGFECFIGGRHKRKRDIQERALDFWEARSLWAEYQEGFVTRGGLPVPTTMETDDKDLQLFHDLDEARVFSDQSQTEGEGSDLSSLNGSYLGSKKQPKQPKKEESRHAKGEQALRETIKQLVDESAGMEHAINQHYQEMQEKLDEQEARHKKEIQEATTVKPPIREDGNPVVTQPVAEAQTIKWREYMETFKVDEDTLGITSAQRVAAISRNGDSKWWVNHQQHWTTPLQNVLGAMISTLHGGAWSKMPLAVDHKAWIDATIQAFDSMNESQQAELKYQIALDYQHDMVVQQPLGVRIAAAERSRALQAVNLAGAEWRMKDPKNHNPWVNYEDADLAITPREVKEWRKRIFHQGDTKHFWQATTHRDIDEGIRLAFRLALIESRRAGEHLLWCKDGLHRSNYVAMIRAQTMKLDIQFDRDHLERTAYEVGQLKIHCDPDDKKCIGSLFEMEINPTRSQLAMASKHIHTLSDGDRAALIAKRAAYKRHTPLNDENLEREYVEAIETANTKANEDGQALHQLFHFLLQKKAQFVFNADKALRVMDGVTTQPAELFRQLGSCPKRAEKPILTALIPWDPKHPGTLRTVYLYAEGINAKGKRLQHVTFDFQMIPWSTALQTGDACSKTISTWHKDGEADKVFSKIPVPQAPGTLLIAGAGARHEPCGRTTNQHIISKAAKEGVLPLMINLALDLIRAGEQTGMHFTSGGAELKVFDNAPQQVKDLVTYSPWIQDQTDTTRKTAGQHLRAAQSTPHNFVEMSIDDHQYREPQVGNLCCGEVFSSMLPPGKHVMGDTTVTVAENGDMISHAHGNSQVQRSPQVIQNALEKTITINKKVQWVRILSIQTLAIMSANSLTNGRYVMGPERKLPHECPVMRQQLCQQVIDTPATARVSEKQRTMFENELWLKEGGNFECTTGCTVSMTKCTQSALQYQAITSLAVGNMQAQAKKATRHITVQRWADEWDRPEEEIWGMLHYTASVYEARVAMTDNKVPFERCDPHKHWLARFSTFSVALIPIYLYPFAYWGMISYHHVYHAAPEIVKATFRYLGRGACDFFVCRHVTDPDWSFRATQADMYKDQRWQDLEYQTSTLDYSTTIYRKFDLRNAVPYPWGLTESMTDSWLLYNDRMYNVEFWFDLHPLQQLLASICLLFFIGNRWSERIQSFAFDYKGVPVRRVYSWKLQALWALQSLYQSFAAWLVQSYFSQPQCYHLIDIDYGGNALWALVLLLLRCEFSPYDTVVQLYMKKQVRLWTSFSVVDEENTQPVSSDIEQPSLDQDELIAGVQGIINGSAYHRFPEGLPEAEIGSVFPQKPKDVQGDSAHPMGDGFFQERVAHGTQQESTNVVPTVIAHHVPRPDKVLEARVKDEGARDRPGGSYARNGINLVKRWVADYFGNSIRNVKVSIKSRFQATNQRQTPAQREVLDFLVDKVSTSVRSFAKTQFPTRSPTDQMATHHKKTEYLEDLEKYGPFNKMSQTAKIKTNERHYRRKEEDQCEGRARTITSIDKGTKQQAVKINYILQDFMMQWSRAQNNVIFAPGFSASGLCDEMTKKIRWARKHQKKQVARRMLEALEEDGSAWDSAQHWWWMAIDQAIFAAIMPRIQELQPDEAQEQAYIAAQCASNQAQLQFGNKQFRGEQVIMVGLTFSGHPTRTTVGNTWRMQLRQLLIHAIAGVKDQVAVIGGDDVVVWQIRDDDRKRVTEMTAEHTRATVQPLMGVVLKPVKPLSDGYTNFYSKDVSQDDEGPTTMTRMVKKALIGIHFASKTHKGKYSDAQWSGRWYGIAIMYNSFIREAQPATNSSERQMRDWFQNLADQAQRLSETQSAKKTPASKLGYNDQMRENQFSISMPSWEPMAITFDAMEPELKVSIRETMEDIKQWLEEHSSATAPLQQTPVLKTTVSEEQPSGARSTRAKRRPFNMSATANRKRRRLDPKQLY